MGGPGSGRRPGSGKKALGAKKLVGKNAAFGKQKGFASNKIAARETNKMFKRSDIRNAKNTKRAIKG
jgi:hypothetical protein